MPDNEIPEDLQLIRESTLFDADWYLENYPDVKVAGEDPALHYLSFGVADRRNPGPNFDTTRYLERYPDVAASGQNPLVHYLAFGSAEGREICIVDTRPAVASEPASLEVRELVSSSGLFDVAWYLERYPDVAATKADPMSHYLSKGMREGRDPGPIFSTNWYLERHPELLSTDKNPLVHYLTNKDPKDRDLLRQARLLAGSSLFDSDWYRKRYQDPESTNPIFHYLTLGLVEQRHPGPSFDAKRYLAMHPDVAEAQIDPLVHYLDSGAEEERQIYPLSPSESLGVPTLEELVRSRFHRSNLRAFPIPPRPRRLTLVMEDLNLGPMNAEAGIPLIFAVLLSERIGATLRLIVQAETPDFSMVDTFLRNSQIAWSGKLEVLYSPIDGFGEFAIAENDFFLTTSWKITNALRTVVDPSRVIFLVQQDERMLYPFGDDRLVCEETLSSPDISFVVYSQTLFEHFTSGSGALSSFRNRGVCFEPAFPLRDSYSRETSREPGSKSNFFFDAHPNNPSRLYWRGLEAIGEALASGILRPEQWDFYFVGKPALDVHLLESVRPQLIPELTWEHDRYLLSRMDVALCLLDNPAPSYLALGLAAGGAVIVTNRSNPKTLSQYSDNIICVDSSVPALERGIGAAVQLAGDGKARLDNQSHSGLLSDWSIGFESALKHFEDAYMALAS